MGMFDSVILDCPKCGGSVEFQSKAGECTLHRFREYDAIPQAIAEDIRDDIGNCLKCNETYSVVLKSELTYRARLVVPW